MNFPASPSPAPQAGPAAPTQVAKRNSCLLYGCVGLVGLLLVIGLTAAITLWWIQRPIKPVVLSTAEKAAVDDKLRQLDSGNAHPSASAPARPAPTQAENPSPATPKDTSPKPEPDRLYTPGSKVLRLTERELNGLLNANTDLGESVRIELARDAINAYLAVPIPKDFPIGGGKMFRARGRFRVSLGNGGAPVAMLEDITVFGLSLPKEWLGGLKGENLISDAVGKRDGSPVIRGIKSLRVEPGALVLEVED
jgi:hypothetical protein